MALVKITIDRVEMSESQTVFYSDSLENFKNDCVTLEILIPKLCSVVVFSDEGYLNHVMDNGNQKAISVELENFCKFCFSKKLEFQKLKSDREKDPKISFATKKSNAAQKVSAVCSIARLKISGTSDPNKTASWSVYIDIARSFKNGTASTIEKACLEQEVLLRNISGETVSSFVDKIFQNYEAFFKATVYITGSEKRAYLDIDQSLTDQDLENAILKLKNALSKI